MGYRGLGRESGRFWKKIKKMKVVKIFIPALIIDISLIRFIDIMTNIVTKKFLFDSVYYILLAEKGFTSDVLASPFVYRYATPLIAGAIHNLLGISIYNSFKSVAYLGGFTQLIGIFCLILFLTNSYISL